jgi:23S rRNA (adenine2503-C2)-methyltransferase
VRPRLAISLNAPNDEIREAIMPITRKWKIEDVIAAAGQLPLRPRERVTFEYVLLGGLNDGLEHAHELIALARQAPMPVKVNLIAWNPGPGVAYTMPEPARVMAFQQRLIAGGVPAYLRRPRGRDIYAACGQLKRTVTEIHPAPV